MKSNFILENSFKVEQFMFNIYKYSNDSNPKGLTSNEFSKILLSIINKGISMYGDLNLKRTKKSIIAALRNRQRSLNVQSLYLGPESELFYCGYLEEVQDHLILTRKGNLEKPELGQDIISVYNNKINYSEVKSSLNEEVDKIILNGIESIFCKQSRVVTDINNCLDEIPHFEFSTSEKVKLDSYLNNLLESLADNRNYEDILLDEYISGESEINLLLLSKKNSILKDDICNIEDSYLAKHCNATKSNGKFKCNGRCRVRGEKIKRICKQPAVINVYHVTISDNFNFNRYIEEMIYLVDSYEDN